MAFFYDENMNEIKLPDGVIPLEIDVSSIGKERVTLHLEGAQGKVDSGYFYNDRNVFIRFLLKAKDKQDYRLIYDEVFNMFHFGDYVYVVEPFKYGKRILVTIDNKYMPEKINEKTAIIEIECITVKLPFSESIGTTQDIQQNGGITYDSELWSYGMGLLYDEESHIYTHNTRDFSIYNAGNVPIHPFEQDLLIAIDNASKNYELKNLTTGDTFKYTGDTQGALKLDGPNITLNSLQVFRDTNKRYITLAPGWNHFTQNQSREVSFDFRYYYL